MFMQFKEGVVAQNAFKLEYSEPHIFFYQWFKWGIYVFDRILIFYHVVLKISRLENCILVISNCLFVIVIQNYLCLMVYL